MKSQRSDSRDQSHWLSFKISFRFCYWKSPIAQILENSILYQSYGQKKKGGGGGGGGGGREEGEKKRKWRE